VGGDAIRTYRLYKRGLEARGLVGSALMDRLIGTFSIVGLGIAGLILSGAFSLSGRDLLVLFGMETAAVIGFAALFMPTFHDLLQRPLVRFHHKHLIRGLSEVIELCHSYGRTPGLLVAAVVLSVLMQSTEVMIYVTLGNELGLDLPLGIYFAVVPISFIAAALPISLGGLGVREGVLVSLLVAAGADKQAAVALAVLFLIVLWTSVLPGLLLFLRGRH
jgi:glycosyltransferase 2 family protein